MVAAEALGVPGLYNFRDVGGGEFRGARQLRPGVLFRSEAPLNLSVAGRAAILELGIATVVDLREHADVVANPTALARVLRVVNAPIPEGGDGDPTPLLDRVLSDVSTTLRTEDVTRLTVEFAVRFPEQIGRAVGAIIATDSRPVLVHCKVGKDRTGLVVAVLLDALGIDRSDIVTDYELSTTGRAHRRAELLEVFERHGVDIDRAEGLFTAKAETLNALFEWIDATHGSSARYLRSAGVAGDDLERASAECVIPTVGARSHAAEVR